MTKKALILIPTRLELDHVRAAIDQSPIQDHCRVAICGFGIAASSARTMQLIHRHQPDRLILMGIAGGYLIDDCLIGSAFQFREVAVHGIGISDGAGFQSAGEAGWLHWRAEDDQNSEANRGPKESIVGEDIGDRIKLNVAQGDFPTEDLLLTVCGASQNQSDRETRLKSFTNAACEDMEGFGVATAAKLAGLEVRIIRGISNEVGNRDFKQWKTEQAIQAAWQLVEQTIRVERNV